MSQWRVIDLADFEGKLSYRRGGIVLTDLEGNEKGSLQLADVCTILIGHGVTIGRSVLQQLCEYDVVLLPCNWRKVPLGTMSSWSTHTRVGARHLAQSNLSLPRKKNAWGRIVSAKIAGQASTLEPFDPKQAAILAQLSKDVRSGDPANLEAQAARMYWSRLFAGSGFSRNPDGEDNRNALLNYGYTVMRGYAIKAIASAGLSPALGMFHRGRSNAFNLADDLIEPFRPALDATVSFMSESASLEDKQVKHALVAAADCVFSDSGRTVSSELTALAQQFGRYVEGDIEKLPVPQWRGGFFEAW